MKSRITSALKILISIGLIVFLFYIMRDKYGDIIKELKLTDFKIFLFALGMYFINIAINTLRFRTLIKSEKIQISFVRLMELNFIGFFFNNFMPSAIGGDIIKAYYAGKVAHSKSRAYMCVFMDRLTGLFSFAGLGLIALIVGWNSVNVPGVRRSVAVFVIVCVMAAFVSLNAAVAKFVSKILAKIHFKNIGQKLIEIYEILHSYKNRTTVIIKSIVISLVSQSTYFLVIYILFISVHCDISLKLVFLVMPLVCVVTLLPSLGGLGLREGAIVALFGPIIGMEKAFGVGILLFVILFIISIVGGIIYITSPQFRVMKLEKEEE